MLGEHLQVRGTLWTVKMVGERAWWWVGRQLLVCRASGVSRVRCFINTPDSTLVPPPSDLVPCISPSSLSSPSSSSQLCGYVQ